MHRPIMKEPIVSERLEKTNKHEEFFFTFFHSSSAMNPSPSLVEPQEKKKP